VALVGAPNSGKSTLFGRLTGRYATVSNYPGTSVEVARGAGRIARTEAEILDTPGLYSLLPGSEEERVARRIALEGEADVLVHVVEARSLDRSVSLALELAELGRPMVLAVNMVDELRPLGLRLDAEPLARRMGVEVVPVVAVTGEGMPELEGAIRRASQLPPPAPTWGDGVGDAVEAVASELEGDYGVRRRAVASLLYQGDEEIREMVARAEPSGGLRALREADRQAREGASPPAYRAAVERRNAAEAITEGVLTRTGDAAHRVRDRLGRLLTRPLTGIPVLLLVLYLGLYQFVGLFGAGTVVDWLEASVFETWVTPFLEGLFRGVPWEWMRELWVGEFGVLTLGVRYAVAIILPVVGAFFLFFSVLEDSGYLPRLALLVDRLFKKLGLNGRAVIPIVLGFACDTMATMVTRTLETRRERMLSTVLLALAVPCSAQLGVILAVLSGQPLALGIWAGAVAGTFLLVGAVGARLLPGRTGHFRMELPPLRWPRPGNVLRKTYTRMHWYFLEVLPLFLLASVILWIGDITGILQRVLAGLRPVVGALGLPAEAATVFLFGFFRRDYGAAGLFDLNQAGALDPVALTVAAVTLTLFVPCVAQFLMMWKERGARAASAVFAFATLFAFGVGVGLNQLLRGVGL
jgi:ferrous iron transport protein B